MRFEQERNSQNNVAFIYFFDVYRVGENLGN